MARPQRLPLAARDGRESSGIVEAAAHAESLFSTPSTLRAADEASAAIGSPALALQAELAASFAERAYAYRLPPGPLVLTLIVGSLILWTIVAVVARAIFF